MTAEHDPRSITVVTCDADRYLTKLVRADGSVANEWRGGDSFKYSTRPVDGIAELYEVLSSIARDPRIAVLRDAYVGTSPDRDVRTADTLAGLPSHVLPIDIDGWPLAVRVDPFAGPEATIRKWIAEYLSPEFHRARFIWMATAKTALAAYGGFYVRLWFYTATPYSRAQVERWARKLPNLDESHLDPSLYTPARIIFTAPPRREPGAPGFPWQAARGLAKGELDEVPLVLPEGEIEDPAPPTRAAKTRDAIAADPVVAHLEAEGLVKGQRRDGGVNIRCPFADEHTGESSTSGTVYWPAHTGGYAQGHFDCKHSHCASRSDAEFLAAIGLDVAGEFEDLDEVGEEIALRFDNDLTDSGNANLLQHRHGGNLRYVHETERWLVWHGDRWSADDTLTFAQKAAQTVSDHYRARAGQLLARSSLLADVAERKRLENKARDLLRHAARSRSRAGLDNLLTVASRNEGVPIGVSALDREPMLLGVENGVVDLRTGQLRADARDDFVTKRCRVAYDPSAPRELFERFIREITGELIPAQRDASGAVLPETVGRIRERERLAVYLKRLIGYVATGLTREQKLFLFIGCGSNGKSILLDLVIGILGDYARVLPAAALMTARFEGDAERPTPLLASLAGARLAVASESKDGQNLDVGLIKAHTGDGRMVARKMRENSFEFDITHKLILATNARPGLGHLDEAIRGRLHLVPFDVRWNRPGHAERDPALPDGDRELAVKLRTEAPGILAWIVEGAREYLQFGLDPPPEVIAKTGAYLKEQDALGRWLELCERVPVTDGQLASELFAEFCQWADSEGAQTGRPHSLPAFGIALGNRNIASRRYAGGRRWAIRSPQDDGITQELLDEFT